MANIDEVRAVIAGTFKLPVESVRADTAMGSIPAWDSVGQVNLMMAIEQEFDIFLEVEDFARLISVPAIAEYLDRAGG